MYVCVHSVHMHALISFACLVWSPPPPHPPHSVHSLLASSVIHVSPHSPLPPPPPPLQLNNN